jgi:aspartyl protease family protein
MINGSRVRMLVDTGASIVVLSKQDARRMGINPAPSDFRANASTANGIVLVAPVVLKEISVGELSVYDVQGAVHPDNIQISLLGMSLSCEAIAFRNWWRSARSETVIARYQTLQLPTDLIRY